MPGLFAFKNKLKKFRKYFYFSGFFLILINMNRKHRIVLENEVLHPVKDYMRENQNQFTHIIGRIPTSEEIGKVLVELGYRREDTETHVLYRR